MKKILIALSLILAVATPGLFAQAVTAPVEMAASPAPAKAGKHGKKHHKHHKHHKQSRKGHKKKHHQKDRQAAQPPVVEPAPK